MMQAISNQVPVSLILLWSHQRGELCNKHIVAAQEQPEFTIVTNDGTSIDITTPDYDGTDAYGVHFQNGQVYYANAVFNGEYIHWPVGITDEKKSLIVAQLAKTFLIIK